MTDDEPQGAGWYVMHDHGDGAGRHSHSTAYHHAGDVTNPRANDHTGVEVTTWAEHVRRRTPAVTP